MNRGDDIMEDRMSTPRAEPEPEPLAPSPAHVIVFDAEPTSRDRLRDALAPLGLAVLEARTPLEVIHALVREPLEACVAFVGRQLLDTTPDEFVRFALEEFPGLTLVTTGEHDEGGDERVLRLGERVDTPALADLLARLRTSPLDLPGVA